MFLKSYRGSTVKELLAQARLELGPDALVLSTRLVSAGGWRGWMGYRHVELTAAAPRGVSENRPDDRPAVQPSAPSSEIVARLSAAGLSPELAADLERTIPEGKRRGASAVTLRRALAQQLDALVASDGDDVPVEVFVGPPGVGKTTTIAKIAAQERALRGRTLTLVSADGYRVGAVEQLRLYADIIGSPFMVARSADELKRALARARGPVLVDTAGRSPSDSSAPDLGAMRVRTHLVLPATGSARELSRTIGQYRRHGATRVALTRVDEAESLSPIVDCLREASLPVSYVGLGQRVPDDLERATGSLLAGLVLGDSPYLAARPA